MISNLFPPVVSGSSLQLYELSKRLVRRGHRVIIVTARYRKDLPEHEVDSGIDVYRLPSLRLPRLAVALKFEWLTATFSPANLRRIKSILRRHSVDLIHLHNHMFDLAFSAALVKRALGLPLVVSLHTPITHNNPFYNRLLVTAERLILKPMIIGSADCVVCPDYNIVKYVKQRFDCERVALIPYGVDEAPPLAPDVAAAIAERFALQGSRLLLSIGHVHQIRNRIDFVRAMADVVRHVPEAKLIVVGAVGDQRPVALAKELGLTDRVIFTGTLDHATTQALLAMCEIEAHWFTLKHPPIDSSPGIATMEAMLAGKPALTMASEDTFGPGVLRNFENVVLVKPGDAAAIAGQLVRLLCNAGLAKSIGDAGRKVALEHFTWPHVIGRMEALYGRLIRDRVAPVANVA